MAKKNAYPSPESIDFIETIDEVYNSVLLIDQSNVQSVFDKIKNHQILNLPNGIQMIVSIVLNTFKNVQKSRTSLISLIKSLIQIQNFKELLLQRAFAFDSVYVTFSSNRGNFILIARLIDEGILQAQDIFPYLQHYVKLADDYYPHAALLYYTFAPEISTNSELNTEFTKAAEFIHKNNLYDFHFQKLHESFSLLSKDSFSLLKKYRDQGFMDMSTEAIVHNDAVGALSYIENLNESLECSIFEPSPFLENHPTPLMLSAFCGSSAIFNDLVAKTDINGSNPDGYTVAQFAAAGGQLEFLKKLNEMKADFKGCLQIAILNHQKEVYDYLVNVIKIPLNNTHPRFSTPLVSSIFADNVDVFLSFAKKDKTVDANAKDKTFMTPIHQASGHGSICILQALLMFPNANVNAKDKNESTPFIESVSRSQISTLKVLLQNDKLDVNAKDKRMQAAIHIAATNGDTEIIETLLSDKRTDANIGNRLGNTAMILALENKHTSTAITMTKFDNVKSDARNTLGVAPIHVAVERNYEDVVKTLIEKKVDINVLTKKGKKAPLHTACELGFIPIINLLLSQPNIKVNIKNSEGWTSLHYAAEYSHLEAAKLLVSKNADINALNIGNETPLHFALQAQLPDVAEYLLSLPNIDVKTSSVEGWTSLHFAANNGYFNICVKLIEMYKEAVNSVTSKGKTPLFCAAQTGKDAIMRLLIENGADPAAKDIEEKTPLHYASENGHIEAMNYLLQQKSVDVNAKAFELLTPLHLAARYNRTEAMKILLSNKNIEPNCETEDGITPFKYAVMAHADDCIAILKLDERIKQ